MNVDSYLRLDAQERAVYEQEAAKLAPPEKEKVMAVVNEWTEAEQVFVPFFRLLGRLIGNVPPEVREGILSLGHVCR
jgi:hypothetical protein